MSLKTRAFQSQLASMQFGFWTKLSNERIPITCPYVHQLISSIPVPTSVVPAHCHTPRPHSASNELLCSPTSHSARNKKKTSEKQRTSYLSPGPHTMLIEQLREHNNKLILLLLPMLSKLIIVLLIIILLLLLLILLSLIILQVFYYAPSSRPEGLRRCPDRGNAGGHQYFCYGYYIHQVCIPSSKIHKSKLGSSCQTILV